MLVNQPREHFGCIVGYTNQAGSRIQYAINIGCGVSDAVQFCTILYKGHPKLRVQLRLGFGEQEGTGNEVLCSERLGDKEQECKKKNSHRSNGVKSENIRIACVKASFYRSKVVVVQL